MTKQVRRLTKKYGGRRVRFKNLSLPYQLAIAHYMAIDGEAWVAGCGFVYGGVYGKELKQALPELREKHGKEKFGIVTIPTKALIAEIVQDNEFFHTSFEEYHQWFLSFDDVPEHSRRNRWPVILGCFDLETLQDGWHRLHCYFQQRARVIPCVYLIDQWQSRR